MTLGLGYALDGVRRGQQRRRAIDIQDENREIAKTDRDRRIRHEDEDRSISVPVAKSSAERTIAENDARKQVLPGQTDNLLKKQQADSGALDHQIDTMDERNALDKDRIALESDQVGAQRQALPGKVKLDQIQTDQAIGKAEFDLEHQPEQLMRQEDIQQMQHETMQMEQDIARILQGARTAEAETALAKTQHKIYGNIYQIAKSDPATAAKMVNDVKSNGIDNAASIVFEDGKMRIVDANGQTVSDPQRGPAEFDVQDMEQAFGAKAEKGTFKVSKGIMYDTRNGAYEPITDENGQPIKDGDTAKLERYIQNDIWKRAGDTFGAKLGDDFSFSGEGAKYATEAQTRAFQYYKQAGDGDLTKAWQRSFDEVQATKIRDEYRNKLSGAGGSISDADRSKIAADLESFFVSTDRNPSEVSQFMTNHGVKKIDDRIKVLEEMGYRVKDYNGKPIAEYNGQAFQVQ